MKPMLQHYRRWRVEGAGALQHTQGRRGQQAGTALLLGMIAHIGVDTAQQVSGQGDIEFFRLAQVLGDIDVHQGADAARVVRTFRVLGHGARPRYGGVVLGENLQMPFDGFTDHGQGVVQVFARREAARNIRNLHAPSVFP